MFCYHADFMGEAVVVNILLGHGEYLELLFLCCCSVGFCTCLAFAHEHYLATVLQFWVLHPMVTTLYPLLTEDMLLSQYKMYSFLGIPFAL